MALLPGVASAETIATVTKHWKKADGFLPLYTQADSEKVLVQLKPGQELLYGVVLAQGVGSTQPMLARAGLADLRLCRFERFGNRVLLVHRSTKFREGGSADGSLALAESFAPSVIGSFGIEAEEGGSVLIDMSPYLLDGRHVRPWIAKGWSADSSRSLVLIEHSGAYPRNTEVETLITLSPEPDAVDEFANLLPDSHSMTLRVRHTFLKLPEPGFELRIADPRVGFFGPSYRNLSAADLEPVPRRLAARWRIEKPNRETPVTEPMEAVVLNLDPAIPSRYRDAVRRGALWWNHALAGAGFSNAITLRDLPEGATFADARYSGIQWVHRADGGTSLGQTRVDPRTGEILHAVVSLDSAFTRVEPSFPTRPMFLGADVCALVLEPRSTWDLGEKLIQDELAWLTAHEVGHVLGLAHNMAASTYHGSVMDYLPADLRLEGGRVVVDQAYPSSVGPYDEMAVKWAYTPSLSPSNLEAIVHEGLGRGLIYPQTDDARWALWDLGSDPVRYLDARLALRRTLLSQLDSATRQGEPIHELYRRFESTYNLHVPAIEAAAQQVGGVLLAQAVQGDGQQPFRYLPVEQQRRALEAVLRALLPENLRVPAQLKPMLLPSSAGPDQERFTSEAGLTFSPVGRARQLSELILLALLGDPSRLARLTMAPRTDGLSLDEVVSALIQQAWRLPEGLDQQERVLLRATQGKLTEVLLLIAKSEHVAPEARAAVLDHLTRLRTRLALLHAGAPEERAHLKLLRRQLDEFLAVPTKKGPTDAS